MGIKAEVDDCTDCVIVSSQVLVGYLGKRCERILGVSEYMRSHPKYMLTRPLLGMILSEASQLEELLDAYGSRNNQQWHVFRHLIASAKRFSSVAYTLLHIQHSIHLYRLLYVEGDICEDTEIALRQTCATVQRIAANLVGEAKILGMEIPHGVYEEEDFDEGLPPGRLISDRQLRKTASAGEVVTHLATEFLVLAAESEMLHGIKEMAPEDYAQFIPHLVNESDTRQVEHKFHNLQSLYDTFVSDTDTEMLDSDLPLMRGHISIIFHLLEIATEFVHYYERHLLKDVSSDVDENVLVISPEILLSCLMDYSVKYASRYLVSARSLCQSMLKKYAEITRIEVPVPNYRGFHVRPSTLIAKIAHHYGSEVRMELIGESYDASAPLDLFRANEHINAAKRRKVAEEVGKMSHTLPKSLSGDVQAALRQIMSMLAAQGSIVVYKQPLPLEELVGNGDETLSQVVVDEVARLLAMGIIDIETNITVSFIGDKRVLEDIRELAEAGYGEDDFGNNIALPESLRYLRR